MSLPLAIETHQLRKEYGDRAAVKSLTLQVQQGEVFGFLGPNGAGKTTSIKMFLGLISPTSGSASMLGDPVGMRPTLAKIGFLPEHFRFQDWLTAVEFLELHGQLYGIAMPVLRKRIDLLLERVGLVDFRTKQLRTFSKGMLQRIGIAQALLNEPALVFLDEPTSGLDPVGRLLVRDIIRELRRQGTCVFLNSHLLSEIEVTCDRVAFINHGEVVKVMNLSALDAIQPTVTIRAAGVTPAICHGLEAWGDQIRSEGEKLVLNVHRETDLPEVARYLVEQGVQVYSMVPERKSLDEFFLEIVGKDSSL